MDHYVSPIHVVFGRRLYDNERPPQKQVRENLSKNSFFFAFLAICFLPLSAAGPRWWASWPLPPCFSWTQVHGRLSAAATLPHACACSCLPAPSALPISLLTHPLTGTTPNINEANTFLWYNYLPGLTSELLPLSTAGMLRVAARECRHRAPRVAAAVRATHRCTPSLVPVSASR